MLLDGGLLYSNLLFNALNARSDKFTLVVFQTCDVPLRILLQFALSFSFPVAAAHCIESLVLFGCVQHFMFVVLALRASCQAGLASSSIR